MATIVDASKGNEQHSKPPESLQLTAQMEIRGPRARRGDLSPFFLKR